MPKLVSRLVAAALFAGAVTSQAHAAPIATLPVLLDTAAPFEKGSQLSMSSITYAFFVRPFNPTIEVGAGNLMLQFTLTAGDLGKTFIASALNMGADFTIGASRLTNATLTDSVSITVTVNPGGGGYGFGTPESGIGLDLRGLSLGSINLIVDDIAFVSPGSNPNGDGRWMDVRFNGRLVFDSTFPVAPTTTPAPASFALFAAGLSLLAASRLRPPYARNGS